MKKLIIISPHFPPSNLTAVHRARIFSNNLQALSWEPILLTVNEKYYEEKLDLELNKLINPTLHIESVNAFPIKRIRLFGDIGIRAFFQLYKRALDICRLGNIDFVYILVPSFYTSLIGRLINWKLNIPYGIDYIDPWVHDFPGSNKIFSRAWFSKKFAYILEPIAVKKASLITGVSQDYYLPIISRNKGLAKNLVNAAMPFGAELNDHIVALKTIDSITRERLVSIFQNTPFYKKTKKIRLVYAGAVLPKSKDLLVQIFESLTINEDKDRYEFYFIGTGGMIESLANKYEIWNNLVFEIPYRVAYLDVLRILNESDGVFILGSTERHYTPSKVFQAIMSKKPILAVLHTCSTAVNVLSDSNAAFVIKLEDENDIASFGNRFVNHLDQFYLFYDSFDADKINSKVIEAYSGMSVTRLLVDALNKSIS